MNEASKFATAGAVDAPARFDADLDSRSRIGLYFAVGLGAGSVIEARAVVVDSVLMDGSHVAADAKVAGSILGPRATVGQRGDVRPISVLGAHSIVASGMVVDGERVAG